MKKKKYLPILKITDDFHDLALDPWFWQGFCEKHCMNDQRTQKIRLKIKKKKRWLFKTAYVLAKKVPTICDWQWEVIVKQPSGKVLFVHHN